jgi:hypothetical protein
MYEDSRLEMDYEDRVSGTFFREIDEPEDDTVTCQGCGAYAGSRMFGQEHIRNGEPCGIFL